MILDEIRSILPVLDAPTLKDDRSITLLDELMHRCRYVIALDADLLLDNMVSDFLSVFGQFTLLEYTMQKMKRVVQFYNREDVWDYMFKNAVNEMKNDINKLKSKHVSVR